MWKVVMDRPLIARVVIASYQSFLLNIDARRIKINVTLRYSAQQTPCFILTVLSKYEIASYAGLLSVHGP